MSSVFVVGGRGAVGAATAAAFVRAGWDVQTGGRRPSEVVGYRQLDLQDARSLGVIAQTDVVVNTAPSKTLHLERHVLRQGGILISVPESPPAVLRQLDQEVASEGTLLTNTGVFPGVAALVVADLLKREPTADVIEIALTLSTKATSGPGGGATLHHWLSMRSKHDVRSVEFPKPLGRRRCFAIAEDDGACLDGLAGSRTVRAYACLTERPAHAAFQTLNRLGLLSRVPLSALAGKPADPGDLSSEPFAVSVSALSEGQRLATKSISGEGDYRCTAAVTVLLAQRLLDDAPPPGRSDLARLYKFDQLAEGLLSAGLRIEERQ